MTRLRIVPAVAATLLMCWVAAIAAPTARQVTKPTTTPVAGQATRPPVDAQSKAILDRMGSFLTQAKAFSVRADVCNEQVLPSGVKVQRCASTEAFLRRPDKLHVRALGDVTNRSIWYDGSMFSILFPAKKIYVSTTAPPTLDAAMDWVMQRTEVSLPMADYFYSDPIPGLLEGVRLSHYLGDSHVMGTRCKHLAFKQANINWQVWVEDSATPVPRKVVVEYKNDPGSPQYTAMLYDWKFCDTLPDDLFVFRAPEDASRIQVVVSATEVK